LRGRRDEAEAMDFDCVFVALALLLSTAACHSEEKPRMTTSTSRSENQVSALGLELGVSIPADAQVVGVKRESGIDDLIRVKLLVPPTSRDRFIAELPIPEGALRAGVGRLGSDDGFWNPHATAHIRSGSKALGDGHFLLIGIADTSGGTIVFLAKHGT